ncbi:MAG TPA: preprotein translocase subunit SecG [Gemmatimonadaceae bacterium]
MYTFLLVILIIDSIVLVAAILMQSAKGGGLAASFGGVSTAADSFIGTRQAGNVLTKIGWWAGGLFLGIAFALQLMSTRGRTPTSILDQGLSKTPSTAPAPITPPPQSVVPIGPPEKGAPPTGSQKK